MTAKHPTPAPVIPSHSARSRLWFWLIIIVAFGGFISLIKGILLPFVVGMLAAYFLDPAVGKLKSWKWSRTGAAAFITIAFFTVAAAICIVLVPLVAHQLSMLIKDLPDYVQGLQNKYGQDIERYFAQLSTDQVETIRDTLSHFSGTIAQHGGKLAENVVQSGLAVLNVLLLVFITPVVAFYLLRDWDKLVKRIDELLPRDHEKTIREQLHEIDRTLAGFIRGQTNVCLIMALYYGILLSIAGLKFGLVIGLMSGFLLFVPFVGYATCFALSMIVALFQFDSTTHIVIIAIIYIVALVLESSILTPKLVGGKVGLHPLWIIFGMLSGGTLFGFVGVLIAVPLTAVIGVLVRFAIKQYLQSSLYKGE